MRRLAPMLGLLALLYALAAQAATYEISTTGSDSSGNGSLSAPYATCSKAQTAMAAGDILEWQPGTYPAGCSMTVKGVSHAKPTIYRCAVDSLSGIGSPATSCIIRATSYQAYAFNAAHILLGGTGHGFDIASTGTPSPVSNLVSPAIQNLLRPAIDSEVLGNYIHDSPGGCITFTSSDWTWVLGNIVARCATGSPNQSSGISVGFGYQAAYDNPADLVNLPYHGQYETLVAGNLSYGNIGCAVADTYNSSSSYASGATVYALDPAAPASANGTNYQWTAAQAVPAGQAPTSASTTYWTRGALVCPPVKTDANGFIIDTNNQAGYTSGPALVENNIAWGNGGRGVHCYYSSGVTMRNNTSYGNAQDTLLGTYGNEVNAQNCPTVQSYGNAAYATQTTAIGGNTPAPFAFESNTVANGDWNIGKSVGGQNSFLTGTNGVGFGAHNLFGTDPKFTGTAPPTSGYVSFAQAVAAFTPQSGSPLLGAGWPLFSPSTDIAGTARPLLWGSSLGTSRVDAGAIQVTP